MACLHLMALCQMWEGNVRCIYQVKHLQRENFNAILPIFVAYDTTKHSISLILQPMNLSK